MLLLDEPLSNLDARLRLEMRTELQRVQRDTGVTMVFVTHDQSEALALADRIVLMRDGKIVQIGTPDELYNQPVDAFAADFMGFENIFAVDGGQMMAAGQSVALGFDAPNGHVAWRPGGVAVGSGPQTGTIIGRAFVGERREYVIDSALGQIKADTSANEPSRPMGAQVAFDLPQANARILPA